MSKNYKRGQAVLVMVVFFTMVSVVLVAEASIPANADLALAKNLHQSKQSVFLAESGVEDVSFRIRKAWDYDSTETLIINGETATTTVTSPDTATKIVIADATVRDLFRSGSMELSKSDVVSFNYGVQAGNGGFTMANSSKVLGNIYANGSVTGAGNLIQGSVVSAGAVGLMSGIHATSSAWAHTIQNSTIDADAYYQVKINTTVLGTSYPGSTDKPTTSFPLSDAKIDEWKAVAELGGVHNSPCPYSITTTVTLGPKKINCSMSISGGATVNVSGMLWVVGDVTFSNSSGIYLASSLGGESVAIIADNPANRSTASKIAINNSTNFYNTDSPGSFLFLISANNSAELGGGTTAIDIGNSAQGPVILYSNHGKVAIANSSKLRSVTGYLITMRNSAQLIYDEGLESTLFDSGPGGSWIVENWKEVQ